MTGKMNEMQFSCESQAKLLPLYWDGKIAEKHSHIHILWLLFMRKEIQICFIVNTNRKCSVWVPYRIAVFLLFYFMISHHSQLLVCLQCQCTKLSCLFLILLNQSESATFSHIFTFINPLLIWIFNDFGLFFPYLSYECVFVAVWIAQRCAGYIHKLQVVSLHRN